MQRLIISFFLITSDPKKKKNIRQNYNSFLWNGSTTSQILTICWIIERVGAINLMAKLLFADVSQIVISIQILRIKQIRQTYCLPKLNVTVMLTLYKNKYLVCSVNGDTDFINVVPGSTQGYTLVPCVFIRCLDNILRTSIYLIIE